MKICFATHEIYPLHPGGIGRMIYSIVDEFREGNNEIHLLLPKDPSLDYIELGSTLGVEIHTFDGEARDWLAQHSVSTDTCFVDGQDHYLRSQAYLRAILNLKDKGVNFDIIEFADFGGAATATLQAREAGLVDAKTKIAVRLHSTFTAILAHEPSMHYPSEWIARICSMEQFALKHADLVVGHLPFIPGRNRVMHGLDEAWQQRVLIESPPILPQEIPVSTKVRGPSEPFKFVFSSRLQMFKRPDLFIRGAIQYLDHGYPDAEFVLASYGWDQSYIQSLKDLIPTAYKELITFEFDMDPDKRLELLSEAIIVIPSEYESLCLFAYEASLAQRPTILNGDCDAFGDNTPWKDDKNCLKFDGSAYDLAEKMKACADGWEPTEPVSVETSVPYWQRKEIVDQLAALQADPSAGKYVSRNIGLLYYVSDEQHLAKLNLLPEFLFADPFKLVVVVHNSMKEIELGGLDDTCLWTSHTHLHPDVVLSAVKKFDLDVFSIVSQDVVIDEGYFKFAADWFTTHQPINETDLQVVTSLIARKDRVDFTYGDETTLAVVSDRGPHEYSFVSAGNLFTEQYDRYLGNNWLNNYIRWKVSSNEAQVAVYPQLTHTSNELENENKINLCGALQVRSAMANEARFLPMPQLSATRVVEIQNTDFSMKPGLQKDAVGGFYLMPWKTMSSAILAEPAPPDLGYDIFSVDGNEKRILTHAMSQRVVFGRIFKGIPPGTSTIIATVRTCHPEATELDYAMCVSQAPGGGVGGESSQVSVIGAPKFVDEKVWDEAFSSGWTTVEPMTRRTIVLNLPAVATERLTLNFGVRVAEGQSPNLAWAYWEGFVIS